MLALLERGAVRDVWDVANLNEQARNVLKDSTFRARFIALSAILEHPLSTYHRERLESFINDRLIDERLRPLISGNPQLKTNELDQKAWAVVGPFLEFTTHEKEYLQKIQAGVLQPELLFPDDHKESAKFAKHPAILWKIANVRSHLKARKGHED